MASGKKRRKVGKIKRLSQQPARPGPFRHKDGDRRHKESMRAAIKEAAQRKAMEQTPGVILPEEPPQKGS
jgi:hypothetical protein